MSLNPTTLAAAQDKHWCSLIDRLSDGPDEFSNLTADERAYFVARWFKGEVNNGGFEQYFFNSAGDHYQEALVVLKHFGAKRSAALLLEAARLLFGRELPPRDSNERVEIMGFRRRGPLWEARMDEIENAFFDDPDGIDARLVQFAMGKKLFAHFLE